jgi:ribosome biogenesis GTPase A
MANQIKIFFISCNSRDGIKKLKEHIDLNSSNIQLIGMPNTGKTTLLNILARLKKSVSKIPGTTTKISEH